MGETVRSFVVSKNHHDWLIVSFHKIQAWTEPSCSDSDSDRRKGRSSCFLVMRFSFCSLSLQIKWKWTQQYWYDTPIDVLSIRSEQEQQHNRINSKQWDFNRHRYIVPLFGYCLGECIVQVIWRMKRAVWDNLRGNNGKTIRSQFSSGELHCSSWVVDLVGFLAQVPTASIGTSWNVTLNKFYLKPIDGNNYRRTFPAFLLLYECMPWHRPKWNRCNVFWIFIWMTICTCASP